MEGLPGPEWPGAVSGKFTDRLTGRPLARRVVKSVARSADGIAWNGLARFLADPGCQDLQPPRRRLMPGDSSEVAAWRPCRRVLPVPGELHLEKPEGVRAVPQPARKTVPVPERRHLRQVSSLQEIGDRPVGPRATFREDGSRAADQRPAEADVALEMQRKARTLGLFEQRNGIGCRSLGDKSYRQPEYKSGFYQAGELAVGSSFARGSYPKTEPRNSTSVQLAQGDRGRVRSYEEKLREQQEAEAQLEVKDLTKSWEASTLKECDARYVEPSDSEGEGAA